MSTHGYTNDTVFLGSALVRKSYRGSDAAARQSTELACLGGLADHLPVPVVAAVADRMTEMQRLPGQHGQDLIDDGRGSDVMHEVGALLQWLQALPLDLVQPPLPGGGDVLVHGDYG
ncbi:MAG: aminoglycoside phosphotransferase, partial [Nocardioidaceae bacterium]